ncbi:hypothetical protein [Legionella oakridgensis]|uniref:hypothetical protein n=1 Tax=Legionella oakridgensis TaxID=29423 RepID=UPI0003DE14E6|nr:hypothetical protein [Legionella oakridgensis]ETO94498.1 hypothetical protein LOR_53c11380 [Legionella oakridgensis RV-2-2007]
MTKEHESTTFIREMDSPDKTTVPVKRSSARKRSLAERLHKAGYIYALYGALDGLSLSYSTIKYSFDLLCTNNGVNSSDLMHDWMTTPGGALVAATGAITLIGFSLLANVFNEKDKNAFKRYVATLWPYFRDTLKGLKNAYKGVRSTMMVASIFAGQDLNYLIVPVGLVLGILSVFNRIWYRSMKDRRKVMMKENAELLAEIQAETNLTEQQCAEFRKRIAKQTPSEKIKGLLSQAYSGIIDGLYLYMGIMGLATLAPPVFVTMAVFCVIFTLTCIITRVYEEYDYQRKLVASQAKIELALCGKELEALFNQLQQISDPRLAPPYEDLQSHQKEILQSLESKIKEFEQKRNFLRSQVTLSYTSSALDGLKSGLAAYGAIASLLFAVATIYTLTFAPFPPLLLMVAVFAGLACLIGFVAHSLHATYIHRCKQEEHENKPPEKLSELLKRIKDHKKEARELQPDEVEEAILGGMVVDPSPQFFFQEWFEVIRSFFSGVSKGQKSIDYTFNSWQEADEQGHYHDTPIMLGLAAASAVVYSSALALRAHARGFGRPSLDSAPPKEKKVKRSDVPREEPMEIRATSQPSAERGTGDAERPSKKVAQPPIKRPASTPPASSSGQWLRFFQPSSFPRSASADDLPKLQKPVPKPYSGIIPDLV